MRSLQLNHALVVVHETDGGAFAAEKGHARPASVADAEPSPSTISRAKIDPALRALQEAAWAAYCSAALRHQEEPSAANWAACARTHAAFERLYCGPADVDAKPIFMQVHGWDSDQDCGQTGTAAVRLLAGMDRKRGAREPLRTR